MIDLSINGGGGGLKILPLIKIIFLKERERERERESILGNHEDELPCKQNVYARTIS